MRFLLVLLAPIWCLAQQYKDYNYLKSQGPLPSDFTTLSSVKYHQDLRSEKMKSKNSFVDKTKEEFLLKSNYIIDELLMSGKILFGDSVTTYVNKVAAEVLRYEPDLREKLRFYVMKSSVANAFSTNQGIIFVTLGLISQLENEAQLAYVLAHEISHFEKRHTINSYIENEKIFSTRGERRYSSHDSKVKAISNYSKNLELEADSLGIYRYARSEYKPSEVITAFDVMQFSYLPFGDFDFSWDFLTANGKVVIPKKFWLDTIKPIDFSAEESDDTRSTHPNVRTRRDQAETMLKNVKCKGTKTFLQSKELFFRIRNIARYETLLVDLNDRQYIEVVYNALFLLKENPKSMYLRYMLAKALYGAAVYKSDRRFSKVGADYENIEGNSQRCYYLLQKLEDDHLMAMAFRHIYDLHMETKDPFLDRLATDLLKKLAEEHRYSMSTIKEHLVKAPDPEVKEENKNVQVMDSVKTEPQDTSSGDSKYSNLRKKKKEWIERKVTETRERETPVEDKYHYMAFDGLLEEKPFLSMWDRANAEKEKTKEEEKARQTNSRGRTTYSTTKTPKGNHLNIGLDTLVVVDPFFFSADDRQGLKLMDSEQKLLGFTRDIQHCASLSGINMNMLAPKDFKTDDASRFNDLALINDWMDERIDHGETEIIPLHTDMMHPLSEKYNTNYFCYTGVVSVKQRRENSGQLLLYGCIAYPIFPIMAIIALTPQNRTHYYTLVYDISTGKEVISERIILNANSNAGYVNSVMYDQMLQMKKEPKKTGK